ncbi:MAG: precorrin-6Y C5,15-methyltransferase (decarboxylating) subunit CbiT [Clostridia bacterium]|jgi:cobalt-precorrin-6B (C15)-methyltransferase|nr:precorrin-6Y C5,15-methyltransferase (decarboxylating) subunit CbiT [Clostridia bacterium]MDH7573563.1 precorrin-6Y C5,15-methyltransferase (decarboxylating) subunit CbiT [Clostridia bacterium]
MPEVCWPYLTPGIPEDRFLLGEVPVTRLEVRVVWLALTRLAPGQVVWDVGAGTGSVSVEAARLVAPGPVWAVERDPRAASLVRANAARFGTDNLRVVEGEAPEALAGLPAPDRVLVGGSGGRLEEILSLCAGGLRREGILVASAVTWETMATLMAFFDRKPGWEVEAVCLNVARLAPLGGSRAWKAQNPVYLVRAARKGEDLGG